ncbi:MAG: prepilin-type N-terminal cleavage/methylation domain-containing protein [Solobacterium sp.]|nr:prepilin-type N-terminal cleavage/methylation domain-containing protein [Solobacterium sp.]
MKQKGFTLVELIVVLAILAVLSAIIFKHQTL